MISEIINIIYPHIFLYAIIYIYAFLIIFSVRILLVLARIDNFGRDENLFPVITKEKSITKFIKELLFVFLAILLSPILLIFYFIAD